MKANEPIFNVPAAVIGVLAVMAAVHAARQLLAPETDLWLVFATAFIPARYDSLGAELPGGELARFTSPITHMFMHGDSVHLALNSAWLLVFGGAIAARTGTARFLAFSALTGLVGAATFYIFNIGLLAPVIGASGAISGLMGGTMRFLFPALESGGFHRLRDDPRSIRALTLRETLTDRRVQLASAALVIMNLLAMLGFGGAQNSAGIAWEAHLGGYVAGLLAFGLFDDASDALTPLQPSDD